MTENHLLQDIADAEMVLVGLGEEFDCTRAYREDETYHAGKKLLTGSGREWLLPVWMRMFREESGAGARCREALRRLAEILDGKNYFVVSVSVNGDISDTPWREGRLVCPCGNEWNALRGVEPRQCNIYHPEYDESLYLPDWQRYTKWLQGTLNRRLLILELGVGLTYPSVIRFPFEKTAYFNQKSRLYRIHESLYQLTPEIAERAVSIPENAIDCLTKL